MTDFSDLSRLEAGLDKTARLTLYDIDLGGKTPTLIMRPATNKNRKYLNARLAMMKQQMRGNLTAEKLDQQRDQDRELFPRHVVVGWEDVCDTNGAEVPFSEQACTEFIAALPDWLFDDVRNFAADPLQFIERGFDPDQISGN